MKLSLKSGLFWGLVVGVITALLYAPKSGKELRHELKDKVSNVPHHFFNFLESLVDLAVSVLDFAKSAFREQKEKFSNALNRGINAAKEKAEELRKFTTKVS